METGSVETGMTASINFDSWDHVVASQQGRHSSLSVVVLFPCFDNTGDLRIDYVSKKPDPSGVYPKPRLGIFDNLGKASGWPVYMGGMELNNALPAHIMGAHGVVTLRSQPTDVGVGNSLLHLEEDEWGDFTLTLNKNPGDSNLHFALVFSNYAKVDDIRLSSGLAYADSQKPWLIGEWRFNTASSTEAFKTNAAIALRHTESVKMRVNSRAASVIIQPA